MRAPREWTTGEFHAFLVNNGNAISHDGVTWHPARPQSVCSWAQRIRRAWDVLIGRADVLRWLGD